ncbi:MAG: hypothetical protein OHK0023_12500 [Anaerolineae bacterium]
MENQPYEAPRLSIALPHHRVILTYVILAVIVGIFLIQMAYNQLEFPRREPITAWGMINYTRVVYDGEWYRLFTAMFLHANEVHLLFNGLALWSFGRSIETLFGTPRFALIYFLGGLTGSLASLLLTRGFSVGASGAIFAIFGAEMIFLFANRKLLGEQAQQEFRNLVGLAALNFGFGILSSFSNGGVRIDNWAHIGGFIGGVVLTWFVGARYRVSIDPIGMSRVQVSDEHHLGKSWWAAAVYAVVLLAAAVIALNSLR